MPHPRIWCLALFLIGVVPALAQAQGRTQPKPFDWPQWQGPQRTAVAAEKGLLKRWPKEGPRLLWKTKGLGGGYCTPSVASGRILGMSYRGDDEVVWALNESTGKELWKTRIAKANRGVGSGEGSRCTPTVAGDRLYALGVSGDLICLEVASGKQLWQKNLVKDFGGSIPSWGYCESPLVDGERVIATPGGKRATLVALNKKAGATLWTAQVPQGDGAHYSSAIVAEVRGQRQYIQFLRGGVVGVAAADGRFLWRYDHPANSTANCSTPVFSDNAVFAASSYGTGGGLVELARQGDETTATEVYFTRNMKNHHGGMVLVDGYLYGSNEGLLTCLDFKTGQVMWEDRTPGKGSIAYADGCLYYRNEGGRLFLVDCNPKQFVELGRFAQPERSNHNAWPHPVVANGKLYILDQDILLCFDVKKP